MRLIVSGIRLICPELSRGNPVVLFKSPAETENGSEAALLGDFGNPDRAHA
jgi:hypothetical protein